MKQEIFQFVKGVSNRFGSYTEALYECHRIYNTHADGGTNIDIELPVALRAGF